MNVPLNRGICCPQAVVDQLTTCVGSLPADQEPRWTLDEARGRRSPCRGARPARRHLPPARGRRSRRPTRRRCSLGAMFAVKRNAVIGFNLYCGGGSPGLVPASPAGEQTPPPAAAAPAAAAATVAEVPRPLIGSAGLWAAAGRAEAPRAPIGSGAAPHAPIGSAAARRAPPDSTSRPVALWSPEEELDGCEPESERGPGGDSLPGTPPELPDLLPDELRQESLELILRYLREAAGEAEPGVKKLFPGLLGGPGRPGRASSAVMEKALETLRRVGDGVMQKHF